MLGITIPRRSDPKVERLRGVPLFAGCSDAQLVRIAGLADEVEVPAGRRILRQGRVPHEFVVLVEGEAEARRDGELLRRLGAGDFVGELSLLSGGVRTATVVTTTPARLLVLTDRSFERLVECVPGLSLKLMRALVQRTLPHYAPGIAA